METRAQQLFYGISIFVLTMVFFVIQPNKSPQVSMFQDVVKQQVSEAWAQTWTDQPIFSDLGDIYQGVTEFYNQSADSFIALISQPDSDADMVMVYSNVYKIFAEAITTGNTHLTAVAATPSSFSDSGPIQGPSATLLDSNTVAGTSIAAQPEIVNPSNPWFTAMDAVTGQKYCMAIYNGEVNKYLGACQNDYH